MGRESKKNEEWCVNHRAYQAPELREAINEYVRAEEKKLDKKLFKTVFQPQNNLSPDTFQASSSISWSDNRQSRQWDERIRSQSNQGASSSAWDRRANHTPFTSPFGKK